MTLLVAERPFVAYGPSHWALVVLIAGGSVLIGWIGHRTRDAPAAGRFARLFSAVIVALLAPLLAYYAQPGRWDVAESLPLHLCDLAWMVAAYALWTRQEWARALTYYWGLTLAPQAIFTPALVSPDFPHVDFVHFWGQHLLVIWAAVYLTWGLGLRPSWRSYWRSAAITVAWGVAMLLFNAWAGTNYGYVSSKPTTPSLLDLFGGWPWYLGVELVVGLAGWALVTWPWNRGGARARGQDRSAAPPPEW